jgi:cytochrome P450
VTILRDAQVGLMMFVGRNVVRGHALRGDALAKVLSRRPNVDPYPLYDQVRAQGPLFRGALRVHATASHATANTILRDQRFGVRSSDDAGRDEVQLASGGVPEGLVHPIDDSFLSMDPPSHTRLRRTVGPWFTPRALNQRTDRIEKIVERYLDELSGRDDFDLIDDFAVRVPVQVICDLLGISSADRPKFILWGAEMAHSLDGVWDLGQLRRLRRALAEMDEFFNGQIELRRREPGDDVISGLAGTIEGEAPTAQLRRDLVATAGLLLVAGFETTVNLIGNAVTTLLGDDSARDWFLANPEQAPALVEEVLRLDPPVHQTMRMAREPVEVAGVRIPRDGAVLMLLGGANRDPEVFDHPNRFDPNRPNNRDHLAFSAGIHYCLGAGLARIEAAVALRQLFQRFPDLGGAGAVRYRHTRNIHGVRHLPVRGRSVRRDPTPA